jgi:hypothetical protein
MPRGSLCAQVHLPNERVLKVYSKNNIYIGGVNKIGQAYGVKMQNNGNLVKRSAGTAFGRRRIKYKQVNHDEQKKELEEIFANNRYGSLNL